MIDNPNDSKIFRRHIRAQQGSGDWDSEFLAHISRYEKAASLMIALSRELGRPLRVLDIGCGEMWPLRSLISEFWVAKPSVLKSYLAVDIESQEFDFIGSSLRSKIDFRFSCQDLTVTPTFPTKDSSIDFALSLETLEHMAPQFVKLWLADLNRCMASPGQVFISTPNRDYGREQPQYHGDYEWSFSDLKEELCSYWQLEQCYGVFMHRGVFKRVNREHGRIPSELVKILEQRFGPSWFRNVVAAPYPEYSENVGWLLRS